MRLLGQQIAGRSHALIRQCRRYANGISTYRATVRIQQAQDHQSRAPFRRRRAIRAEGRGSRSKIRTRRRRRRRRFTGPDVIEIIMLREKKKKKKHQGQSLQTAMRLHHAEHRPLNPFSTLLADTCENFLLAFAKEVCSVRRSFLSR